MFCSEDWYKDDPEVEKAKKDKRLENNAANSRQKNRPDEE